MGCTTAIVSPDVAVRHHRDLMVNAPRFACPEERFTAPAPAECRSAGDHAWRLLGIPRILRKGLTVGDSSLGSSFTFGSPKQSNWSRGNTRHC